MSLASHERLQERPPAEDGPPECPICGARLPPDADECPRCGEIFSESALEAEETPVASAGSLRQRPRILLYLGILLIVLGGPGIALGSWLHDVLRISYLNYDAFNVFGPVNRLVVALGIIVMIVGIVLVIVALRLTRPAEGEDLGPPWESP